MIKAKSKINERKFQRYMIDYLVNNNGFIERKNRDFNRYYALNPNDLYDFLLETQKDKVDNLIKVFKDKFEDSFYQQADEALLDGLSQNQEFFTMLLNDEKIKKRIFVFFVKDIYEKLRK